MPTLSALVKVDDGNEPLDGRHADDLSAESKPQSCIVGIAIAQAAADR